MVARNPSPSGPGGDASVPHTRVAIPRDEGSYEIVEVSGSDFPDYTKRLLGLLSSVLRERGYAVPESAMREVIDNLVHAIPCAVSVVLDPRAGNIYLSDTGPGIARLDLAFEPGYSTADESCRRHIRGVGIGLRIAREEMRSLGGDLIVFSDAGTGTYVQLVSAAAASPSWEDGVSQRLTQRQNNILFLLSEGESLGPSQVSAELNIGVSTAHRDLVKLQEYGLITSNSSGKRFLSETGRSYLQSLLSL